MRPTREEVEAEITRQREMLYGTKAHVPQPNGFILYALKLEDDCYYVGTSLAVFKRISIHELGKGAAWTRLHHPVALIETIQCRTKDKKTAEQKESLLTLQYMKRYGWRNVRGGYFCNVDELLTEKNLRAHGVFEMLNLISI